MTRSSRESGIVEAHGACVIVRPSYTSSDTHTNQQQGRPLSIQSEVDMQTMRNDFCSDPGVAVRYRGCLGPAQNCQEVSEARHGRALLGHLLKVNV